MFMPLLRGRGQPIALADGIHFPMQDAAGHMVFCRVRYDTLKRRAGCLAGRDPLESFANYRHEIEAAADALHERGLLHITVEAGHLMPGPCPGAAFHVTDHLTAPPDPMSPPPTSPSRRGD